jgi:uncharacterized lipoprotein YmbA
MRRVALGPKSVLASIFASLLAGCASAPVHYLTLVPAANQGPAADGGPLGATVSVTIPSQVDQPELVIRLADGSMGLLESERWIAPLRDEIRVALTLALAQQWAAAPAAQDARRPAFPAARVNVDVQRFDSVPGQYILFEAVWTLTRPDAPGNKTVCRSSIRNPVGNVGYTALAIAHQAAIKELASQIASQALNLQANKPATTECTL